MVTSFLVFNKPLNTVVDGSNEQPLIHDISDTKYITLSYKQSVISLEYAALDFGSADRKNYAYKLEGFDAEWNFVGSKKYSLVHKFTRKQLPV